MGKIFKRKETREKVVMASAPEEEETEAEIEYTEKLSESKPIKQTTESASEQPSIQHIEVPVCMSQSQINSLVIDNNMMLKHIISKIEEEE